VKTFGYPEFFVPPTSTAAIPRRQAGKASAYPSLLQAANAFITRLVEHYQDHLSIVAWQLEHEAVDPLAWSIRAPGADFVKQEADALRKADPAGP